MGVDDGIDDCVEEITVSGSWSRGDEGGGDCVVVGSEHGDVVFD